MSVNLEVKGSLAKCLATENLIIEHKKIPTAYFDVNHRILALPNWERASAVVYDLLVGHEVGHALFTDNIDWSVEYPNVPKDFINVLEDARVERLMKKKYPGLSRTFYTGYNELNNDDFFSTKEENLDKLPLIDRINLYFKIGAFHNIAFTDDEDTFVTRTSQTETFREVLELAQELTEFVKNKKLQQPQQMPEVSNAEGQTGNGGQQQELPQGDSEEPSDMEEGEGEESFGGEVTNDVSSEINGFEPSDEHGQNELESKTSRSFDEKSQDLNSKYTQETHYVELPEVILENVVISNDFIHKKAKEHYIQSGMVSNWFTAATAEYMRYKKSAEKEVSYLVKEFECKKSANQYARSSTARTGVLDTAKLHTYKFNEDLFKKVSVVPDGKNHGLIFILDWSGSMANWMLDTYKQLLNLVWFCKKVNIPFEVYAFTLDCNAYMELQPNHPPIYKKVKDVIALEQTFRLMNFFTSSTNTRVLEEQLKNIWAACYAFQNRSGFVPHHLELSGSPIGESIISLHKLIPAFQQKNKLQKVNVIFLTDGEGYQNAVTTERKYANEEPRIAYVKHNKTSIRDRMTGRVYRSFDYDSFPKYAKILLETVKDRFPTVNLINFRITPSRDFSICHRWYGNGNYDVDKVIFRKNQCITFKDTGFDQFNVIASTSLAQDEEFKVEEDATKAQIKSAFVKMLGKKKTNKKILASFVEMIA
jgi:predicted RNase H-like HicB family nuclease